MNKIHPSVLSPPLSGLVLRSSGKVRDTYALPDHPDLLLVVASDRISIFDFVLRALVPQKGAILTAMNTWWRLKIFRDLVAHDLVACGADIASYLPEHLRENTDLFTRAVVVRRLSMFSCEAIARGCLTGSGLDPYRKDRVVCGHTLPEGLQDGDELPYDLFTPSTKAEVGHDEHITADWVRENIASPIERRTLQLFALARKVASARGIILADTKFEWGSDADGVLTLGDEVLTPDSSRFWDAVEWEKTRHDAQRRSPTAYDKQFVRAYGMTIGINPKQRDPANEEDVAWVHEQEIPTETLDRTTRIYRYIFWRLTGMRLEQFQRTEMKLSPKPRQIEIISGSDSDLEQMWGGLDDLRDRKDIRARRHVLSCHRNPEELRTFIREHVSPDSVIVAGAGLAAALPGIVKSHLTACGKSSVPVIGVAFEGRTEDENRAAQLSLEQLPGKPVILGPDGKAYFGAKGFRDACAIAADHEFLPGLGGKNKEAQMNIPLD